MESHEDLDEMADTLRERLRKVYRLKGGSLEESLQMGHRVLPRAVLRDGQVIVEALARRGHPLLERTLDTSGVEAARARMMTHLTSINVWDVRKGKLLKVTGVLAFNFLVVVALFITWMVWSGQL